jgi:hypothetical protein
MTRACCMMTKMPHAIAGILIFCLPAAACRLRLHSTLRPDVTAPRRAPLRQNAYASAHAVAGWSARHVIKRMSLATRRRRRGRAISDAPPRIVAHYEGAQAAGPSARSAGAVIAPCGRARI